MKRIYWIWILLTAALLGSCDGVDDSGNEETEYAMEVSDVSFGEKHKTFIVSTRLTGAKGTYRSETWDTASYIVNERNRYDVPKLAAFQPILDSIVRTGIKSIDSLHLTMVALVDLSLPQNLVSQEQKYICEIRDMFGPDNLLLAFIRGDSVTETMSSSDYVLDNYFISEQSEDKRLYRAVLTKMKEVGFRDNLLQGAKYSSLIIFSDGGTYSDVGLPIDPNHFELQTEILNFTDKMSGSPIYFVPMSNVESGVVNDAENLMRSICSQTTGKYIEDFDWSLIQKDILAAFNINYTDFEFYFSNPDGKLYNGKTYLELSMIAKGDEAKLFCTDYVIGNLYDPVIINGMSTSEVIAGGLLCFLALGLLLYLVFQFIVPYIKYLIFKHKYVVTYTGPNMTVNGRSVGDCCYLCKAPFKVGDKIIVKCEHTMHAPCWRENGYHCPEYGRHCPEGSHYYNEQNLFDTKNAPYYLQWLMAALMASFISTVLFTIMDLSAAYDSLRNTLCHIWGMTPGTPEAEEMLEEAMMYIDQYPGYGFIIGFVLTFMLSLFTVKRRGFINKTLDILIRSAAAGICGYIVFMLDCIVSTMLDLHDSARLLDWIPWTLTGIAVVQAVTFGSKTKPHKGWFLGAMAVGMFSMLIWDMVFSSNGSDYRMTIILCNFAFASGLALSIATHQPKSERYFLHISGAIKEMDIALYKWFTSNPEASVTIGKSVDCGIQISWDINNDIPPVACTIQMHRGAQYLKVIEGNAVIYKNKWLPEGKKIRLYHGRSFSIGQTTFTYIEKDID